MYISGTDLPMAKNESDTERSVPKITKITY